MELSKEARAYLKNRSHVKIAEIGVCTGRTTTTCLGSRHFRHQIKEWWGIDPYEPYVDNSRMGDIDVDTWQTMYRNICRLMIAFPPFKIIKLKSEVAAKIFPPGYFDIILIDGDHSYEHALEDIRLWAPKLRLGGILCGHDYDDIRFPGVKCAVDEIFGTKATIEPSKNVWSVQC